METMEVGPAANSTSSISGEDIAVSPSCYCRKPRNLFECEIVCNKCGVYFHTKCLKNVKNVHYKRVAFCIDSYVFVCTNCNGKNSEFFKYKKPTFRNLLISYMAQMTISRVVQMSESGLIKKEFIPKPGTIFLTIHHVTKNLHEYWHLARRQKKKEIDKINADVKKCIQEYPQIFKVSPSYTTSFALNISLYEIFQVADEHPHKEEVPKQKIKKDIRKKYINIPTGDAIVPPCPFDQVPLNGDTDKHFPAEYDPHCRNLREIDKQEEYYTFRFRQVIPDTVTLSLNDKAKELVLSNDRLRVIGCEGYRMVRGTHSVSRGTWYFEAIIEQCAPKSCVRIGWSQIHAPLDCTVGYSKFSYGIRSIKGTKFHNAIGKTYYRSGLQRKDVIGVLIHLPDDGNESSKYTAESKKTLPVEGLEYRYFKKHTDGYVRESNKLNSDSHLPGSRIEFFVNGKSCGVAFENIYRGFYFPSISLYGYECPPEVSVKFDSSMEYLPKGARPMGERAEEQIIELAVNEMVDFVDAEQFFENRNRRIMSNSE